MIPLLLHLTLVDGGDEVELVLVIVVVPMEVRMGLLICGSGD